MDDGGSSAGFLVCKIGIACVAIAFIGFSFSFYSSSARLAGKQELEAVADTAIGAIWRAELLPDESELRVGLSANGSFFEISITGELEEGLQLIQVRVTAGSATARELVMATIVNGGDFYLHRENPHELIVSKEDGISVGLS